MVQNKGNMKNIQGWEGLYYIYFCVTKCVQLIFSRYLLVEKHDMLKLEGRAVTRVCLLCLKTLSCASLKANTYAQILWDLFLQSLQKKYSIHL